MPPLSVCVMTVVSRRVADTGYSTPYHVHPAVHQGSPVNNRNEPTIGLPLGRFVNILSS